MPKIIVDFVTQKKKTGWILFTFLILVSLDENYKQVEKSFPKIMKESHDFKYKRDFSNFCRFFDQNIICKLSTAAQCLSKMVKFIIHFSCLYIFQKRFLSL